MCTHPLRADSQDRIVQQKRDWILHQPGTQDPGYQVNAPEKKKDEEFKFDSKGKKTATRNPTDCTNHPYWQQELVGIYSAAIENHRYTRFLIITELPPCSVLLPRLLYVF